MRLGFSIVTPPITDMTSIGDELILEEFGLFWSKIVTAVLIWAADSRAGVMMRPAVASKSMSPDWISLVFQSKHILYDGERQKP